MCVITNYKDWIFIDSIGLQSLWIQSSDSFSQGWIFQPLKQRGWGPIYREIPPPKSRQGLDLGYGLWPRFWAFQSGLILGYLTFICLTLTLESSGLEPSIDLKVASSSNRTLTWESSLMFDLWVDVDFDLWPLTLTFDRAITWTSFGLLGRGLTW